MTWDDQQQQPTPPAPPQWGPQPAPKRQRDYGRRPGWTLKRFVIPGAVALFFVGVAVGTSGSGDSATTKTTADAKPASMPTVTTTPTVTARPAAKPAEAKAVPTVTVTVTATKTVKAKAPESTASEGRTAVPNFVGMGLQAAQDKAQSVGFYLLKSHDSTGADRFQVLDRDWKVCSQNVKPGRKIAASAVLDFGAVKLSETCP